MVTIRLTRRGAKNQPFYHVVVQDSRKRQGGSIRELVGFFNPVARGKDTRLKLDLERIDHWLKLGAQESDRVRQLVVSYRKDPVKAAAAPPKVVPPQGSAKKAAAAAEAPAA